MRIRKKTLIGMYSGYIEDYYLHKKRNGKLYQTDSSFGMGDKYISIRATNNWCNITRFINSSDFPSNK